MQALIDVDEKNWNDNDRRVLPTFEGDKKLRRSQQRGDQPLFPQTPVNNEASQVLAELNFDVDSAGAHGNDLDIMLSVVGNEDRKEDHFVFNNSLSTNTSRNASRIHVASSQNFKMETACPPITNFPNMKLAQLIMLGVPFDLQIYLLDPEKVHSKGYLSGQQVRVLALAFNLAKYYSGELQEFNGLDEAVKLEYCRAMECLNPFTAQCGRKAKYDGNKSHPATTSLLVGRLFLRFFRLYLIKIALGTLPDHHVMTHANLGRLLPQKTHTKEGMVPTAEYILSNSYFGIQACGIKNQSPYKRKEIIEMWRTDQICDMIAESIKAAAECVMNGSTSFFNSLDGAQEGPPTTQISLDIAATFTPLSCLKVTDNISFLSCGPDAEKVAKATMAISKMHTDESLLFSTATDDHIEDGLLPVPDREEGTIRPEGNSAHPPLTMSTGEVIDGHSTEQRVDHSLDEDDEQEIVTARKQCFNARDYPDWRHKLEQYDGSSDSSSTSASEENNLSAEAIVSDQECISIVDVISVSDQRTANVNAPAAVSATSGVPPHSARTSVDPDFTSLVAEISLDIHDLWLLGACKTNNSGVPILTIPPGLVHGALNKPYDPALSEHMQSRLKKLLADCRSLYPSLKQSPGFWTPEIWERLLLLECQQAPSVPSPVTEFCSQVAKLDPRALFEQRDFSTTASNTCSHLKVSVFSWHWFCVATLNEKGVLKKALQSLGGFDAREVEEDADARSTSSYRPSDEEDHASSSSDSSTRSSSTPNSSESEYDEVSDTPDGEEALESVYEHSNSTDGEQAPDPEPSEEEEFLDDTSATAADGDVLTFAQVKAFAGGDVDDDVPENEEIGDLDYTPSDHAPWKSFRFVTKGSSGMVGNIHDFRDVIKFHAFESVIGLDGIMVRTFCPSARSTKKACLGIQQYGQSTRMEVLKQVLLPNKLKSLKHLPALAARILNPNLEDATRESALLSFKKQILLAEGVVDALLLYNQNYSHHSVRTEYSFHIDPRHPCLEFTLPSSACPAASIILVHQSDVYYNLKHMTTPIIKAVNKLKEKDIIRIKDDYTTETKIGVICLLEQLCVVMQAGGIVEDSLINAARMDPYFRADCQWQIPFHWRDFQVPPKYLAAGGVEFGVKSQYSPRLGHAGKLSAEMLLSNKAGRTKDGLVLAQTSLLLHLHRLSGVKALCNPCEFEEIRYQDVARAAPEAISDFFDEVAGIFLVLYRKEWKAYFLKSLKRKKLTTIYDRLNRPGVQLDTLREIDAVDPERQFFQRKMAGNKESIISDALILQRIMAGDHDDGAQASKQGWSTAAIRHFVTFTLGQFQRVLEFEGSEQTMEHFQGKAFCAGTLAQAVANKMSQQREHHNPLVVWHTSPSHMTVEVGYYHTVDIAARDFAQLPPREVPPAAADNEKAVDHFLQSFELNDVIDILLLRLFAIHVIDQLMKVKCTFADDFITLFSHLNKDLSHAFVPGTAIRLAQLFKDPEQCQQKVKNTRKKYKLGTPYSFLKQPFTEWGNSLSIPLRHTIRVAFMTPDNIISWDEMVQSLLSSKQPETYPKISLDLCTHSNDRKPVDSSSQPRAHVNTPDDQTALLNRPYGDLGRGNVGKASALVVSDGIITTPFISVMYALRREWQMNRAKKMFETHYMVRRFICHHLGSHLSEEELLADKLATDAIAEQEAALVEAIVGPGPREGLEAQAELHQNSSCATGVRNQLGQQADSPDTPETPAIEHTPIWAKYFHRPSPKPKSPPALMNLNPPAPHPPLDFPQDMLRTFLQCNENEWTGESEDN